jgi:hypothetical protein
VFLFGSHARGTAGPRSDLDILVVEPEVENQPRRRYCERAGAPVPAELEDVYRLTPYGARLRYGGSDPGTVDRRSAQQWAATALGWATEQVAADDDQKPADDE